MKKDKTREWTLESREVKYRGFYSIDAVSYRHSLFSGEMTAPIEAELFVRDNVVGVLPYDPMTDRVALIEQFRIGAMHNLPDPWLLQVIAGMIDTDETPEEVAKREAYEEAGIKLDHVKLISRFLASPGASTEEVFVFFAETDLSGVGGTHGLAEEDEDIRVRVISADKAISMLDAGEIRNSRLLVIGYWLLVSN